MRNQIIVRPQKNLTTRVENGWQQAMPNTTRLFLMPENNSARGIVGVGGAVWSGIRIRGGGTGFCAVAFKPGPKVRAQCDHSARNFWSFFEGKRTNPDFPIRTPLHTARYRHLPTIRLKTTQPSSGRFGGAPPYSALLPAHRHAKIAIWDPVAALH